jgi:hypothetical protein
VGQAATGCGPAGTDVSVRDGGADPADAAPPSVPFPVEPVHPAAVARAPPVSTTTASLIRIPPVCPGPDGIIDGMPGSNGTPGIDAFVAIGDSFTEGLRDLDPGGGLPPRRPDLLSV